MGAPDDEELDAGNDDAADEDEPAEDPDVGGPDVLLLEVPATRDELPAPTDVEEEEAEDAPDDGGDEDVLLGGREPPLVTMLEEPLLLLLLDAVADAPDEEASPLPVLAQPANKPANVKTTNVTLATARMHIPQLVNAPV